MSIKKIIKANRQKSDIPQLQEEIKHVLGIQDKQKRIVFKKRFTLQLITTLIVILSVTVLGSSFFINPQAPNTPPIVDNEENNGNNNTIILLSQVIENMKSNSYTLSIAVYDEPMYTYKMDDTRIEINYFFSGTDYQLTYYIDLENEDFPKLYYFYDDVSWIQTVEQRSVLLEGYLFAMNWLDPTIIEDDWFEFDETLSTYILKDSFKEVLYANSNLPLLDLQDVHVTMNESNDLIFTLKGQDNEIDDFINEFTIIYSNIGSTSVAIPEIALDESNNIIDLALNTLETYETNQYYSFSIQANGVTEFGFYGTRLGDTILKTGMFTGPLVYMDKMADDTFIQVLFIEDDYVKSTISEATYNQGLSDYYPINIGGFSKEWFDINAPTSNMGLSYLIYDTYYDTLLNIDLGENATVVEAYVAFKQAQLEFLITVDIEGEKHTVKYSLHGFGEVYSIMEPQPFGPKISLLEMIQAAIETKQYVLNQYIIDQNYTNNGLKTWIMQLLRDDMTYVVMGLNSSVSYRYDMYGFVNDQYVTIKDLTNPDFVIEVIDLETYETELNDVFQIQLDLIPASFIEQLDSSQVSFEITESLFETIASTKFQSEHTFVSGQFKVVNGFLSEPMFSVTLQLINKETNLSVTIESLYSSVGIVILEFPNEDKTNTEVTIETLLSLLVSTESYAVVQYTLLDDDMFIIDQEFWRDGDTYIIYESYENNNFSIFYYNVLDELYYKYDNNNGVFSETTLIDKATFTDAVIQIQWLQLELLTLDLFENVTKEDDVWVIEEALWLQLVSEDIRNNYTDFNGTLTILDDDFGGFLTFSLKAIDLNTNEAVSFEIDVYYIGQIILNLPEA